MLKILIISAVLASILSSCAYRAQDKSGITIGRAITNGILIHEVKLGGPADKAGIRPGDVIVAYNGKNITDLDEMETEIEEAPPDKEVVLEVMREDKLFNVVLAVKKKGWQFINVDPTNEFPNYTINLIDDFLWIGSFPHPVELTRFNRTLYPSPYSVYDPDHIPAETPTIFMMTFR